MGSRLQGLILKVVTVLVGSRACWGVSPFRLLSQRLLSVQLNAGFGEKGISSSVLSVHKAFLANSFANYEGRVGYSAPGSFTGGSWATLEKDH